MEEAFEISKGHCSMPNFRSKGLETTQRVGTTWCDDGLSSKALTRVTRSTFSSAIAAKNGKVSTRT